MTLSSAPMLLVIEDSPMVSQIIAKHLSQAAPAYAITVCATGTEALAALEQAAVVGVITDQTLPDIDGITLAHLITTRWPTVPVVLFTGSWTPAVDATARATGCAAVLAKPAGLRELWPTLQALLPPLTTRKTACYSGKTNN